MVTGSRHEGSELTTRARRTIAVLVKEGKCLLELLNLSVCELLCAVRHCEITTSWEQDCAGSWHTHETKKAGTETYDRLNKRAARARCLSKLMTVWERYVAGGPFDSLRRGAAMELNSLHACPRTLRWQNHLNK